MGGVVYLDVDDEITSAVARIRAATPGPVVLVVPYGSRLASSRINFRQSIQCLVQSKKFVRGQWERHIDRVQIRSLQLTTVLQPPFASGRLHQDAAHRLRRGRKEMRAILKIRLLVRLQQSQPRLMHERGGLQRMSRRLLRHPVRRKFSQLSINQRQ